MDQTQIDPEEHAGECATIDPAVYTPYRSGIEDKPDVSAKRSTDNAAQLRQHKRDKT